MKTARSELRSAESTWRSQPAAVKRPAQFRYVRPSLFARIVRALTR